MKKNLAIFLMGMTIATMVLGGCKDKENISKKDGKESESVEDKKTFTAVSYTHLIPFLFKSQRRYTSERCKDGGNRRKEEYVRCDITT